MSQCIIMVHGRGMMYIPRRQMEFELENALFEGLARTGRSHCISRGDIILAYYAHLFEKGESFGAAGEKDRQDFTSEKAFMDEFACSLLEAAIKRGVLNFDAQPAVSGIKHDILAILDRIPWLSGVLFRILKDIHQYFHDPLCRGKVKGLVRNALMENKNNRILLMAYSLGSIICYEVLTANPDLKVHTMMTFGSPLGVENAVKRRLTQPPRFPENLQYWLNYYDDRDIVCVDTFLQDDYPDRGGIKRVNDIRVYNDPGNHHSITGYFSRKRVGEDIVKFWHV